MPIYDTMKNPLEIVLFTFFSILIILHSSCKTEDNNQDSKTSKYDELGQVELIVTGNKQAKKHFNTGILLLHSFEYEDARQAFLKAQDADTTMVMAYWGEAMTYNHSLWQKQEKEEALKALGKLSRLPEERINLAQSELEKDLIKGTNILFGEGTKFERDVTYENYMSGLVDKHPENNEIKAFHAISLLASSRNGRDEKLYNKCAEIAQGIIKENPKHPGALHYLIHAFDDPNHAHLAKSAADAYSKVAPDATHALHMPSHIYVALGLWDEVIDSNIASWNASVKKENKSYHALHWLEYGFLQKGDIENAKIILDKMIENVKDDSTKVARGYLNNMLGAFLVATNDWDNDYLHQTFYTKDLNLTTRTSNSYIKGMKAFENGKRELLKSIIADMSKNIYSASLVLGDKNFAMCSSGGFANKPANKLDIDMCKIMEMQLSAKLALLNKSPTKAIEFLDKAMQLDKTLSYSYGPPVIIKPIYEDYAETLLAQNKFKEANEIYDLSLARNPLRVQSLKGKKITLEKLKDYININSINDKLEKVLSEGDYSKIL